ncbi:MAG TPA: hypothetical protein VHT91_08655 [Kofleriaceae bacterium]|nr:hypothetical protein [Kofleriaceae bacterium]
MSRATNDITIGYTMQSDFWFRVDPDGQVKGKAYATYQPTFDPAGLNGKIVIAQNILNGALSLVPGGGLAVEIGKAGAEVSLAGLVGVVGNYNDPRPLRTGAITGSLHDGTLTLKWAGDQPTGIPVTVALQYIDKAVPLMHKTLETQVPWHKAAAVDAESGSRIAIAQEQANSSNGGATESLFAYWSATRVE